MNTENYQTNSTIKTPTLMIEKTQEFTKKFRQIYNSAKAEIHFNISFENIMNSNLDRVNFLNKLFDLIETGKLSKGFSELFQENIEYIKDFVIGNNPQMTIPVSSKYANSFKKNNEYYIVPNTEDLEILFELIKVNYAIFNKYYKNKMMILKMPRETLNQNMLKVLEIEKKNLAHILGITEHNENEIVNYFVEQDKKKNPEYYNENGRLKKEYAGHIAEGIIDWILSPEGQIKILKENKKLLEFIESDKKKNPNSYDEYGNIKNLKKFKKRYGRNPFINFSRLYVKNINSLNFLGMNNITEMISDYNNPRSQEINDVYLLSSQQTKLVEELEDYEENKKYYQDLLKKYVLSNKENEKEEIKRQLEDVGIIWKNIEDILSNYKNLIQTKFYVGNKTGNIENDLDNIINQIIQKEYSYIYSLFGYRSIFEKDESSTQETNISLSSCVTSIPTSALDLSYNFYKNGRRFFVDSLFMSGSDGYSYFRISNVEEEILHLKSVGNTSQHTKTQIEELEKAKKRLLKKFNDYKQNHRTNTTYTK